MYFMVPVPVRWNMEEQDFMLHRESCRMLRLSLTFIFCIVLGACGSILPASTPAKVSPTAAVFAASIPCVTPIDPMLRATDLTVAAANKTLTTPINSASRQPEQPSDVLPLCTPTPFPSPLPPTATPFPTAVCSTSNAVGSNQIRNGGFEDGTTGWVTVENTGKGGPHPIIVANGSFPSHSGQGVARFGGEEAQLDILQQRLTIPPTAILSYWYQVPYEPSWARITITLKHPDGSLLVTLAVYYKRIAPMFPPLPGPPVDSSHLWQQACFDLSAYHGQDVVLEFAQFNDNYTSENSLFDDVSLSSHMP